MAARRKSTQFVQSPAVTKCADCGAAILFRLSSLIGNRRRQGLALPGVFATDAGHSLGRLSLGKLSFADWARFGDYIRHDLAP